MAGAKRKTQACPSEEVLTSLFIIFLQRTFLAFSYSIGLANTGLANIGLANTALANTGLPAVAWERTPIPGFLERTPIPGFLERTPIPGRAPITYSDSL
jgi:hypothetical protein